MESKAVVKALGALAQESRLGIYRLLVERGPEGFTPSELAEQLSVPAPTLSFHLKELQHADLVVSRRLGRNLFYSANFASMNELVAYLTENCCSLVNNDCATSCAPTPKPKSRSKPRRVR
ncbi:MAG TPA: metalloregulator ArsR/SmtB family transcription factor [Steroidobacteraceae bacterium]|nr:metalloregulator ArsR/SmtB family transcription factor [Steroidobacteraceae bacterium]